MAVTENMLIEAGLQVGLLQEKDLKTLRLQAKRERLHLLEMITRAGRFPEAALYQALADIRQVPFLRSSDLVVDRTAFELLPRNVRTQRMLLPIRDDKGKRVIVLADPDDRISMDRIERATGEAYSPALTDPNTLKAALRHANEDGTHGRVNSGEDQDPVELLNDVMKEVYLRRASDIHFEPSENGMRIRMRVDGHMQEYSRIMTANDEEALMNRIKVLSSLDIADNAWLRTAL